MAGRRKAGFGGGGGPDPLRRVWDEMRAAAGPLALEAEGAARALQDVRDELGRLRAVAGQAPPPPAPTPAPVARPPARAETARQLMEQLGGGADATAALRRLGFDPADLRGGKGPLSPPALPAAPSPLPAGAGPAQTPPPGDAPDVGLGRLAGGAQALTAAFARLVPVAGAAAAGLALVERAGHAAGPVIGGTVSGSRQLLETNVAGLLVPLLMESARAMQEAARRMREFRESGPGQLTTRGLQLAGNVGFALGGVPQGLLEQLGLRKAAPTLLSYAALPGGQAGLTPTQVRLQTQAAALETGPRSLEAQQMRDELSNMKDLLGGLLSEIRDNTAWTRNLFPPEAR